MRATSRGSSGECEREWRRLAERPKRSKRLATGYIIYIIKKETDKGRLTSLAITRCNRGDTNSSLVAFIQLTYELRIHAPWIYVTNFIYFFFLLFLENRSCFLKKEFIPHIRRIVRKSLFLVISRYRQVWFNLARKIRLRDFAINVRKVNPSTN